MAMPIAERRWPNGARAGALVVTAAVALLQLTGCGQTRIGGSTTPDRVIADLRDQNSALREEVDRLNKQASLRIAELEAQGKATSPQDAPTLASIELAGLGGGGIDTDKDGRDDKVRVYLKTLDAQGRMLPIAGTAVLTVVRVDPDAEPVTLARRAYDRGQFDAAYRSGVAGTHYTLEVDLPSDASLPGEATVQAAVTDTATGVTLHTQRVVKLKP